MLVAASAPDCIDGFRCDAGFQLLNPAYPQVKRLVDVPALGMQQFAAGVRVDLGERWVVLADPRRALRLCRRRCGVDWSTCGTWWG